MFTRSLVWLVGVLWRGGILAAIAELEIGFSSAVLSDELGPAERDSKIICGGKD